MLTLVCPICARSLSIREEFTGKQVRCSACQKVFVVQPQAVSSTSVPLASSAPSSAPPDKRTEGGESPTASPESISEETRNSAFAGTPVHDEMLDFLAPPRATDELGHLGEYRILKVLGQGGMGVVLLAEDAKLRRKVAIKAMLPNLANSDSYRQRFLREAQAAAALEHDHIVPILHVGEDRGVPYIVMPFLKGESLEDRLKRSEPIPISLIVQVGQQAANALTVAHAHGLLHRDIKPANIWLETRDLESGVKSQESQGPARVKLLDFGLVRLAQADDAEHLTQTGAILGTPGYMPPEQVDGTKLDARADLFSLGCVLYRMAVGKAAFSGSSVTARLMAVTTHHPDPPRQMNATIPSPLSDLIMQLLAKKRDDRPASALEVEKILAALVLPDSRPSASDSQGPTVSYEAVPLAAPSLVGVRASATRSRSKVPFLIALAGLFATILFIGGIVHFWQSPYGTVRIESDDPDIEIVFDRTGPTIMGADRSPIPLEAGEHGILVKRGDFSFETDKFLLKRGDTITLQLELREGRMQLVHDGKVLGARDVPLQQTVVKIPTVKEGDDKAQALPLPAAPSNATIQLLATGPAHTEGVTHLAASRDGTKALTYTSDQFLWFWELDGENPKIQLGWKVKVDLVLSLALAPGGRQALLATGASSNLSQVDTQTQDIKTRPRGDSFEGRAVQFSADERRYLVGDNSGLSGIFSLCAWPSGECLRKFRGHEKPVRQLCFSSDGERILSTGDDKTVRLWDSTNAEELKKLARFPSGKQMVIALSPDAKQGLISQENDAQLWDLKTEKSVLDLKGHNDQVTALAFGADGSWAVSASRDKTLRVWDLATGKELAKLEGHTDDVTCLAVASQGRRIISASRDKTLRVWKWNPQGSIGEKNPPSETKESPDLAPWPDLEAPVVLDLTTKLGVQARVKVKGASSSTTADRMLDQYSHFTPPICSKLALDLGNGLKILIPLNVVKRVASQDKGHVVMLIDGSTYTGRILTTVVGEDGKKYELSSVSQMIVAGAKDAKPPLPKQPLVFLSVPKPQSKSFTVYPAHVRTATGAYGDSFKIMVDGESLQGNLSEFARVAMVPRAGGGWNCTIKSPEAVEKTGVFHMPNGWWWLDAEMPNGCLVVLSNHDKSVGFAIEKTKADKGER